MTATQDCRILLHHPQASVLCALVAQRGVAACSWLMHLLLGNAPLAFRRAWGKSKPVLTHNACSVLALQDGQLAVSRQLIGNNDEVTDLRLISAPVSTRGGLAGWAGRLGRYCVAALQGTVCMALVQPG